MICRSGGWTAPLGFKQGFKQGFRQGENPTRQPKVVRKRLCGAASKSQSATFTPSLWGIATVSVGFLPSIFGRVSVSSSAVSLSISPSFPPSDLPFPCPSLLFSLPPSLPPSISCHDCQRCACQGVTAAITGAFLLPVLTDLLALAPGLEPGVGLFVV